MIQPATTRSPSTVRALNLAAALWFALIGVFTSAQFLALYFDLSDWTSGKIYIAMAVVSLAIAPLWQKRPSSEQALAVLHQVIRMTLSYLVLWYGIAKLSPGGQFGHPPLIIAERPYYDLPPFWKAFAFFGHSPAYNASLAAAELLAGVFVWFDRTLRLGLCLLIPVLSNIVMLNIAFHIGVLFLAVQLLVTAIYLVLNDWRAFAGFFWTDSASAARPVTLRPTSRRMLFVTKCAFVIAIVATQVHLYRLLRDATVTPELYGIWAVQSVEPRDSSLANWQKIYFDERDDFEHPDPLGQVRLRDDSVAKMRYHLEPREKVLSITFEKTDGRVLRGSYRRDERRMSIDFDDSTKLQLLRVY